MAKGEDSRFKELNRPIRLIADLLGGATHDRLSAAAKLGIKPAAAGRQLEAISKLPGVLVVPKSRPRKFRFDFSAFTAVPDVPAAVAACFGASLAGLFQGTPYEEGMRRALKHVLKHRADPRFADLDRKFHFLRRGGEVDLRSRVDHLDDVIDAVLKRNWIALTYERFNGQTDALRLRPLSIVVYDHQLYVLADEGHGAPHPYRFARIKTITIEDRQFEYPTRIAYDPDRLFGDSFGVFVGDEFPVHDVRVILSRKWLPYAMCHQWHHPQTVTPVEDGRVAISLRVRLCPEVEAWLLGFGEDAEIVAPVGLRRKIAERHAKAIENEKPRVRAKPLRRPQSERGRHAGRSSPRR